MSLNEDTLKICPYCEQLLKVCYRYCIRCGQEYPLKSIPDPADPSDAANSPVEDPPVAQPAGEISR